MHAMANSRGEKALLICMARLDAFSQMLPLAAHPTSKHATALRLRALCSGAVCPASATHLRICWKLLRHRSREVRDHIGRLVDHHVGHNIWRVARCPSSEATELASSASDCAGVPRRAESEGGTAKCRPRCWCNPPRRMAEVGIIPRLSKVLCRKELLRWLRRAKMTIYICPCGQWYRHLWREARVLILEQRRALWRYLDRVYARATEAKRSQVDDVRSRRESSTIADRPR